LDAVEVARRTTGRLTPERPVIHILHIIIDPDPAIGVVGVAVNEPRTRELRTFERMPGETVEELERRAHEAMGWKWEQPSA
jgi:hypothetical protein